MTTLDGDEAGILLARQEGPVLRLTLHRPHRRNALSRALVASLNEAFAAIAPGNGTRVVVIDGAGPALCSGGDIAEFADAAKNGPAEADAEGLADLFAAMAACPLPIIARVHGGVFGGGVGLVAAADIAIASEGARFSLSEARLGLVAAVISRYVIGALGWRAARAHMLLGSPFDATEALRCGLVHQVTTEDDLDAAVERAVADILLCAPRALATIKRLPELIAGDTDAEVRAASIGILAGCLRSEETQEGLHAFLDKRAPAWAPAREDR